LIDDDLMFEYMKLNNIKRATVEEKVTKYERKRQAREDKHEQEMAELLKNQN